MGRLETSGFRGWWPMLAHRRKLTSGAMVGRECFVNMTKGEICEPEEGWSTRELPYATGETTSLQHQSDAFRERFDRIDWNGTELEIPEEVPPEIEARRRYVNNFDNINWG